MPWSPTRGLRVRLMLRLRGGRMRRSVCCGFVRDRRMRGTRMAYRMRPRCWAMVSVALLRAGRGWHVSAYGADRLLGQPLDVAQEAAFFGVAEAYGEAACPRSAGAADAVNVALGDVGEVV